MEKRFILAFSLSLLVLLFYPRFLQYLYPPKPAPQQTEAVAPESQNLPAAPSRPAEPAAEAVPVSVPEETFSYEDAAYAVKFSNLGAAVNYFGLKAYGDGRGGQAFLFDAEEKDSPRGFSLRILKNGAWSEEPYSLEKKEPLSVVFLREEGGLQIRKSYWFLPGQFTFVVQVDAENRGPEPVNFECELTAPLYVADAHQIERPDLEAGYLKGDQFEARHADKLKKQPYLKEGPLEWTVLERKYFALIVKPETPVDYVRTSYEKGALIHYIKPPAAEIRPGETLTHRFLVYAGPKQHDALKETHLGFERILHTRVLGGLWIYFLVMLKFFYKIFHNDGVAIIVLSSLIKLVFAPLTHMSFDSMRKMQALQPKIKALQEQYKKDPQKMNQEVMELYKRNKVNPFGGCLPLILQMPIFIALYQTFSCAMELRGAPFVGWIRDLSEPDRLFTLPFSLPFLGDAVNVLPVIMIGTMLWQQKLTPQTAATKEQETMMMIMPALFGFIFYGLPSGLVIYWIVNNVLTIAHQLLMRKLHRNPAN
ncbi:MAG: membrane protein insertase YidC [Candidatus Omnitrophica bacterium]|nr:membrane protein insertase YidC [Candidatus Omnitrophota bacterium]